VKVCNTCGHSKPLTDFQRDRQNRDGRKGKCRACVVARQRELRAANPEREREWVAANKDRVLSSKRAYRERNAERLRSDNRERMTLKRSTAEGAERARQITRESRQRHRDEHSARDKERRRLEPVKARAREAVANALRRGRLVRPSSCSMCGTTERVIHAHHDDYARPLDVRWLCASCHRKHHLADARIEIGGT